MGYIRDGVIAKSGSPMLRNNNNNSCNKRKTIDMGTRATISIAKREEGVSFSERPDKKLVSIYHHYDGYPEYLGVTLASYLDDKKITNGLNRNDTNCFNGIACMAASIIAELKDEPGNVYIEDPNRPHAWIDYEYYIWGDYHKDIWISIFDGSECIFVGTPRDLLKKYYTD